MSITFSKEQSEQVRITLDNLFITEYMPFAPDSYVKVYLYGLSLASSGNAKNGTDEISKKLGLDINLVMEAFRYWDGQGLVNILDTIPVSVEYLSVKPADKQIRKFKKEKYKTFNNQLHAMLPSRNFLPNEYNEYYNLIENYHIELEAMLTIIAYCIRLKGESITYPYILAVAKNLAHEGCTTYDRVQERLSELDLMSNGELGTIIKALKVRRTPDHDDRRLFIKWTKTLGFEVGTIIYVAKNIKKGGMERLDALLTKYYESRLTDKASIDAYNEKRDSMYSLAKEINRIIGVYYEQLDYIIETYINKWLSYGFDENTLLTTADYCFKRNVRTIEGMNEVIMRFYKEGLVTLDAIDGFISETVEIDKLIKNIMEKAGTSRKITSWDRDYYRTWTFSWKMPMDVIYYAAELATGKANPFSYMNAILSAWNESNIRTVEDAKKTASLPYATPKAGEIPSPSRNYTSEEINAMFDRLKPEDI